MSGAENFSDETVELAIESLAGQALGVEVNYPVPEANHAEEGAQ
jgi:hypothetical protein